ncbi:MAG: hypothetical protein MJE66_18270 [Proteobacteria bacterium]|nr:hypothetical protein [Pseudomonadota bacterium]
MLDRSRPFSIRTRVRLSSLRFALPMLGLAFAGPPAQAGDTTRVSMGIGFAGGGSFSQRPAISGDGLHVAYESDATNLVVGDTNGVRDVFHCEVATTVNERVSVDPSGQEAPDPSQLAGSSADGTQIVFSTFAALVPGDTNGAEDVYVRDLVAETTTLVSEDLVGGSAGNGDSTHPVISADGHFVAFQSDASDLVAGDANLVSDVFVRDLLAGTTTRVSVNSLGVEATGGDSLAPAISEDGGVVAFTSHAPSLDSRDGNVFADVFVHDVAAGTTELVSRNLLGSSGNQASQAASVSADGLMVAFESLADDLVAGDANQVADVFVYDRGTSTTTRASVDDQGVEGDDTSVGPAISADGSLVAFSSDATNLVAADANQAGDVFVRDLALGTTERVSVDSAGVEATGASGEASISADGSRVAFASDAADLVSDDTNGVRDVFVHDRTSATTTRCSVGQTPAEADGLSADSSTSGDGRFIAFDSLATNLVPAGNILRDVYVYDAKKQRVTQVSVDNTGAPGAGHSYSPSISEDGRYVAFHSSASNLDPADVYGGRDVFVHDRQTGVTTLVSVDSAGVQGAQPSTDPAISADGRHVAFQTGAALDPGDTNGLNDIYVRDLQSNTTHWVSMDWSGQAADGASQWSTVSGNGNLVAFVSWATDLLPNNEDQNGHGDIFVHDLAAGVTTRISVDNAGWETDDHSGSPSISADGGHVAFYSHASNLDPADTTTEPDVYVHDLALQTTTMVSFDGGGSQLVDARQPSISRDGRVVSFRAREVGGNILHVFVRETAGLWTLKASVDSTGMAADDGSWSPSLSHDAKVVSFFTDATNLDLATPDTNGVADVYRHEN